MFFCFYRPAFTRIAKPFPYIAADLLETPECLDWARENEGKAAMIYGRTPIPRAQWLNNPLNLDTSGVFGGNLTALRYPEREIVSVKARARLCGALTNAFSAFWR